MMLSIRNLVFYALFFYLLLVQPALANQYAPYPEPGPGYVTDHADLLNDQQERQLEQLLRRTELETRVEIIVVTIRSMQDYKLTKNDSIESFATALFNKYGIGNLPKNDGVLLLVSLGDRRARIELGKHYAHNRDDDASHIMQNYIIPNFKNDDYAAGITAGTEALVDEFAPFGFLAYLPIIAMALGAVACMLIGISCFRNGKRGWGYVFVGFGIVLLLMLVNSLAKPRRSRSSGGFGGGSSGGGGASGGW